MLPADLQEACLRDQLTYLRNEFGKDLRKLAAAERGAIDRACSALRVERGRDEYVACLADRLTRVTKARGRALPSVPTPVANAGHASGDVSTPPSASPETAAGGAATSEPSPAEAPAPTNGRPWAAWLGGLVALCGAGAWALIARRRPKPALACCRVCGELAQTGDLCATCRHEAADAQRRAAAERSETPASTTGHPAVSTDGVARAEAPATAPTAGVASTATTRAAPLTEAQAFETRRREHEQTVQARIEREREDARAQEAERRRWQEAAAAAMAEDSPIDPRSVLGVSADATPEQIRAAYEQAKDKYSPDLVSHLGSELQDLYRTKAQAVERAYQLLQ